ncbi:hypothetical protein GTP45_01090 [Pseudoduganella sp. FT55W]|uniref:Uncharacterized protein n=1 Tax=Duganella rivi TaxID=2666083 RepID=A0A7X4GL09_9BURK|nr:hypothetical protein [Duganella rivi]MYM65427.1 hypothetical protein [Duganella rivi]
MILDAPVQPTPADQLPPGPSTSDPVNFDPMADAWTAAQAPFGNQMNALGLNTYQNALRAYLSALAAAASATDANSAAIAAASASASVKWVSGAVYGDGDVVWAPANHLPYRRIGAGSGAVDPSLDPTHWAIQVFSLGLGGQLLTASAALTATSPAAITVTPASAGYFLILPDATTCQKGIAMFAVYNAGDVDYGIRDNSGNKLGWVRARSTAMIGLSDNTTIAGMWGMSGIQKVGVTAILETAAISTASAAFLQRVQIDTNRTFFLFGSLYGVVFDSSTNSWGAPALIRSGAFTLRSAILSAANQLLVVSAVGGTLQAVTVSVTGVSLNVNSGSAATRSISSTVSDSVPLLAVGASFVLSYLYSQNAALTALTVSGTTPTIGTENLINSGAAGAAAKLFAAGNVVRALYYDGGPKFLTCVPYTVSGASFAIGTAATTTPNTSLANSFRAAVNGNGNIVASTVTNAGLILAIFKLSGATETCSSVLVASLTGNQSLASGDFLQVNSNKTAFIYALSGTSKVQIDLLTDTAGTASAGASLTYIATNTVNQDSVALLSSSSVACFAFSDSVAAYLLSIDCAGAAPVLVGSKGFRKSISLPASSDQYGNRSYTLLQAGGKAYSAAGPGTSSGDGVFSSAGVHAISAMAAAFSAGTYGAAANESWGLETLGPFGATIKRLEACA